MFFELFNAIVSFHGYISKIFAEKLDIFIIIYLNNILVYSKDPSQFYIKIV